MRIKETDKGRRGVWEIRQEGKREMPGREGGLGDGGCRSRRAKGLSSWCASGRANGHAGGLGWTGWRLGAGDGEGGRADDRTREARADRQEGERKEGGGAGE